MENRVDERGRPICPVCNRGFLPTESVARGNDVMVHIECLAEFRSRHPVGEEVERKPPARVDRPPSDDGERRQAG